MGDNTVLNLGSGGDTYASDDIGGVKHQRIKNEWGPDGTANEVDDADGKRMPIKPHMASVATRSAVGDNAANVSLLPANATRKGVSILNDSSAMLYVALGTVAASLTDYTQKLAQDQSYDVPSCYTGQINGIWDSDPNDGGARVTELT